MSTQGQLSFDELLDTAHIENAARLRQATLAHLPDTFDEAAALVQELIGRHHRAMLDANYQAARQERRAALELAARLNGSTSFGVRAGKQSPALRLERATAARAGEVPLWGATGSFTIEAASVPVRIEIEGILSSRGQRSDYLGFSANVVDVSRPFLSPNGYRHVPGGHADRPRPGLAVDGYCREILEELVRVELKGKLVAVEARRRRCENG